MYMYLKILQCIRPHYVLFLELKNLDLFFTNFFFIVKINEMIDFLYIKRRQLGANL